MNEDVHKNQESEIEVKNEVVEEVPIEKIGKKKIKPLMVILPGVVVLLLVGFFTVKALTGKNEPKKVVTEEEVTLEELIPLDKTIDVTLVKSKAKDNSVVITVNGLGGNYSSVGYELQYESGGVGKGVTSGSKPLDVTGQNSFEREIYLGTCSKNVCKPDLGVTKVGLVLEFTNTSGKKSQFSKEFEL